MLKAEIVIYIYKKVNVKEVPCNPYYQAHKGTPDPISALASKIVAAVNMMLTFNSMNLLHLPTFGHGHSVVSLGYIRLPHK